jgi:hypothetical protein
VSSAAKSAMRSKRRPKQQTPQEAIDEFWAKFSSKTPGKGEPQLCATPVIEHALNLSSQQQP